VLRVARVLAGALSSVAPHALGDLGGGRAGETARPQAFSETALDFLRGADRPELKPSVEGFIFWPALFQSQRHPKDTR
jgi:hypothetical protein